MDALPAVRQGGGSHAPSKADLQKAHSPTHELPSPVTSAKPAGNGPPSGKQPSGSGRQTAGASAGSSSGGSKAQPTAATPSAAELAKAASESRVSQGAAAR